MAEFLPPNLDDGEEVWLPKRFQPNNNNNRPLPLPLPLLMDMDDLAHHFTTFTLLQRNHPTTSLIPPPPKFEVQRFRPPPVRSDQFGLSQHGYLTANGGGLDVGRHSLITAYETGAAFSVVQIPFYQSYHHHLLEPPQPLEVEKNIVQVRAARVLQSQQNRSDQNRIFPVQGRHLRVGRVVRKSEGTGVFLPRIAATTITTTVTSNEVAHKQEMRSRQETTQMNQPRRIAMGKHEADCHCQLSPDQMDLPQDWTY